MEMSDWLVSGVAISLGLAGLAAAVTRRDWPLRWSIAAGIDRAAGRTAMRVVYTAGGISLIFIGVSILWKA
jgi:hypothetical protein